jgi:Gly-Xaa carboxypeptidase
MKASLLMSPYMAWILTSAGLSKNVYRFAAVREGASINIHTVDERIDMFSHMEVVQFYYDLIRNFDASDA